jgi:hypothetical protein
VRTEQALGLLIQKPPDRRVFTLFAREPGLEAGVFLQHVDPPILGAVNYNRRDWTIWFAINDVLEAISKLASGRQLTLSGSNLEHVLYRADDGETQLALVVIDVERIKVIPWTPTDS